jgi:hypothetical protein
MLNRRDFLLRSAAATGLLAAAPSAAMPRERAALVREIGRLLGPDAEQVLQWMRRAPLHGGLAAELVDDAGVAVANAGDAALSGLLASTVWFAVHALGVHG